MNPSSTCPKCEAVLPVNTVQGLCPKCLALVALGSGSEDKTVVIQAPAQGAVESSLNSTLHYFGDYELLEEIARGGMGVVFKARQVSLNRRVAVKMILGGQLATDADVQRFRTEAEAAANLQHPNIVAIHEIGEHEGRHYFSMDLIEGTDLAKLAHGVSMPVSKATQYVKTIAEAIHYAHQHGTLHRDLKPHNVLIDQHDQPRITDFGLAKLTRTNSSITQEGSVMGSPSYMPPEQAMGRQAEIGPHSDVYSIGAVLYHLLTGKAPFAAETPVATLQLVVESEPIAPSKLNPRVPADLETICLKCLEKRRERRYTSAKELAEELGRFLNFEPILARPPSIAYWLQKTVRRHRLVFAAASAVFLSLAVGLGLFIWKYHEEKKARADAESAERKEAAQRAEADRQRIAAQASEKNAQTQTKRAEENEMQSKAALAASDFLQATRLMNEGSGSKALAHLHRSLSLDKSKSAALTRLVTWLTYHAWALPALSLAHSNVVEQIEFSPDGNRVFTVSSEGIFIWNSHTGNLLIGPLKHECEQDARCLWSQDGKRILSAFCEVVRAWDAETGELIANFRVEEPIGRSTWSQDGKRVAVPDGTYEKGFIIKLWDVDSGKLLGETPKGGINPNEVIFSSGGNRMVTVPDYFVTNNIMIWDAQTGRSIKELKYGSGVAAISPDGKKLVVAHLLDQIVRVWDLENGVLITEQPKNRELGHSSVLEFSPDSKRIFCAFSQKAIIWDAEAGNTICEITNGNRITTAQFSPDGDRIVTGSSGGIAQIWDSLNGKRLMETPKQEGRNWLGVKFSSDGTRIIVNSTTFSRDRLFTSEEGYSRMWNSRTGHPSVEPVGTGCSVGRCSMGHNTSPDCRQALLAPIDKIAYVFGAPASTARPMRLKHESSVRMAKFSPDSASIAAVSGPEIHLWDSKTGKLLKKLKENAAVESVDWNADGRQLLVTLSRSVRAWDVVTGQPLTEPLTPKGKVLSARLSTDGKLIMIISGGSESEKASLWDPNTGRLLKEPLENQGQFHSLHFSKDGTLVVGATKDHVGIWNTETGVSKSLIPNWARLVRISPDGKRMVAMASDFVKIWDTQSDSMAAEGWRMDRTILYSVEFSPDGTKIFTPDDGRIRNTQTSEPLADLIDAGKILSGEFNPDGSRIVTVQANNTVQVWDTRWGQALSQPFVPGGIVRSAQFSPDGSRVVIISSHEAQIWDVGPSEPICPDWLLDLVEAVSGDVLNFQGGVQATTRNRADLINQIRQQLNRESDDNGWAAWGRWFLADPATRAISPFSKITKSDSAQETDLDQISLDSPPTVTLFGMKLAEITPALRAAYDLPESIKGVLILDLGQNHSAFDISSLGEGGCFWIAGVGFKTISSMRQMVTEMLRINELEPPGKPNEGCHGNIIIRHSTIDLKNARGVEKYFFDKQRLELTNDEVAELKKLATTLMEKDPRK